MRIIVAGAILGLTAALFPWWVPLVLFLGAAFGWNELRIARERREWKQDWEQRQRLYELGDRRRLG